MDTSGPGALYGEGAAAFAGLQEQAGGLRLSHANLFMDAGKLLQSSASASAGVDGAQDGTPTDSWVGRMNRELWSIEGTMWEIRRSMLNVALGGEQGNELDSQRLASLENLRRNMQDALAAFKNELPLLPQQESTPVTEPNGSSPAQLGAIDGKRGRHPILKQEELSPGAADTAAAAAALGMHPIPMALDASHHQQQQEGEEGADGQATGKAAGGTRRSKRRRKASVTPMVAEEQPEEQHDEQQHNPPALPEHPQVTDFPFPHFPLPIDTGVSPMNVNGFPYAPFPAIPGGTSSADDTVSERSKKAATNASGKGGKGGTGTRRPRREISVGDKLKALEQLEKGTPATQVCKDFGMSSRTLWKWWEKRELLASTYALGRTEKKRLSGGGRKRRFPELEEEVRREVWKRQQSGEKVTFPEAQKIASAVRRERFPNLDFEPNQRWLRIIFNRQHENWEQICARAYSSAQVDQPQLDDGDDPAKAAAAAAAAAMAYTMSADLAVPIKFEEDAGEVAVAGGGGGEGQEEDKALEAE
ncbi:unnamed protein product [Vitrella brassicaformis CCMP3155]|uniref:HTH CENPB-type domain-containing protein n=2 Tax=Vitrella brassicaformis TaxID=1169539 RepID=A0A0G4EMZ8_VITBC|nr:unnamed protein product [Vitrella brassicaformis CCMP3155]|mmetsp:Transcript_33235/g.82259  ORF Transcript_33235/g.82259 Transcript_33235/m.82259 type:complete len:531 (+) Transcript_33235:178-1770(+)|eukprot:CEL99202.1 unnamed protein product [Vitrella brassicaformis CCMP3155]